MVKHLTLTAIFSVLAIGCGSNSSKTRDYWQLNEPVVHAWDTSEDSNFRGFSQKAETFDSSRIKGALEYGSYIQFTNLTTENVFSIFTTCINTTTSDKTSATFDSVKAPKSQKLYFYNYLPEPMTYDQEYVNAAPDYKCDFRVFAKNKIDTEHEFSIKNLTINTFKANVLKIISKNSISPNISRTIIANNRSTLPPMPSLYYSNNNTDFELKNELYGTQLVTPGEIKCLNNNVFELNTVNNVINSKVTSHFTDLLKTSSTSFLKKCRVFAQVRFPSEDSVSGSGYANEIRTVWSEYFNVIFDEPKIQLVIEKVNFDEHNNYPFNTGNYLDNPIKVFNLKFKNMSDKKIKVYLPSDERIEATISPLIFDAQRSNFKPASVYNWGGFRIYGVRQEFKTELNFVSNGLRVLDLNLEPNEEKMISLELEKNFSCHFNWHKHYRDVSKDRPNSERGFRLKAIDLKSIQNLIKIDFLNQGKMESFPDLFSFDYLINSSRDNLTSIRNVDKKQRTYKTNFLQLNMNRDTVIDTLVLRPSDDLVLPGFQMRNNYFRINTRSFPLKKNSLPDRVYDYNSENEYCQQVY